jgi:hypothetical protein
MLCNLSFSINSGRSYARILELSGTEISSCIFLVNIGYSFRYPNFKLPNRKPERRGLLPISGRRRASPAAPFPAPRSPLLSWSGGLRARPSSPRPICNSASTSAPGSRRQHPRGTSPFRPPFRLSVRLHLRPRHASPPPATRASPPSAGVDPDLASTCDENRERQTPCWQEKPQCH